MIIVIVFFAEFIVKPTDKEWIMIIALVVALIIGIIVGVVVLYFMPVGFFALGAWLGIVLSFFIYNLALYKVETSPPGLILYISFGVLGLILGIVALYIYEVIIIISSSVCGAYFLVRGLSLYIGKFPGEFELANFIKYGKF